MSKLTDPASPCEKAGLCAVPSIQLCHVVNGSLLRRAAGPGQESKPTTAVIRNMNQLHMDGKPKSQAVADSIFRAIPKVNEEHRA